MKFRWNRPKCDRHFKSVAEHLICSKNTDHERMPGIWASLDKSAQAVLVVLLRHADKKGIAFPSEYRLAAMSGFSDRKTGRKAARKLFDRGIIGIKKIITSEGHRQKIYNVISLLSDSSQLNIPSIHIDGGNWACLSPTAKSLAMCFWYFSKPRPDLDPDHDGERWVENLNEYLLKRNVDFCDAEPSVLQEFGGILTESSYKSAIKSLIDNNIICPHPERPEGWMVYVIPPKRNTTSHLNDKFGYNIW